MLIATDYGHVKYDDGRPGGEGEGILGARAAFHAFMANHPEQRITLSVLDPSPSHQEHHV